MPINYKEYHPKWKLISKLIRFQRAKNKCEWCSAINGQHHPVTGSRVVLTVAHIDRNKKNNRFRNLAALCQRCHLNHDRHQHVENRKYGRNWKKNQLRMELLLFALLIVFSSGCNVRYTEMSPNGHKVIHVVKRSDDKRYKYNVAKNIPDTLREVKLIIIPNSKNHGKN